MNRTDIFLFKFLIKSNSRCVWTGTCHIVGWCSSAWDWHLCVCMVCASVCVCVCVCVCVQFGRLLDRLRSISAQTETMVITVSRAGPPKVKLANRRDRRDIKKKLRDVYQGMYFVQNYRMLNTTALTKICKKHDKNSQWTNLLTVTKYTLHHSKLSTDHYERYLRDRIETVYSTFISSKEHGDAIDDLRKPPPKDVCWYLPSCAGLTWPCTVLRGLI